jgi:hypothetical protein
VLNVYKNVTTDVDASKKGADKKQVKNYPRNLIPSSKLISEFCVSVRPYTLALFSEMR